MRYGLLDYLVWSIFLGSAIAAILIDDRWEYFGRIDTGARVADLTFTPDGKQIVTTDVAGRVRLTAFPELKTVWEKGYFIVFELWVEPGSVAIDGDGPYNVDISLTSPGGNLHTIYLSTENGEASFLHPREPSCVQFYQLLSPDGWYLLAPATRSCKILKARYPVVWYGQFYRWEVLAALCSGLCLLYRIIRLRLNKRVVRV